MSLPFAKFEAQAYPFWYTGVLRVDQICGGVPADKNVAKSWIMTKTKDTRSAENVQQLIEKTKEQIRETHRVAGRATGEEVQAAEDEVPEEDVLAGVDLESLTDDELTDLAVAKAAKDLSGLNMFKRDEENGGVLYIEGRQLKAAMREAVSVAANAGKITTKGWGKPDNAAYKKGIKGWFPEHVFVIDDLLFLRRSDGSHVTEPDDTLQKFVHTHRGDAIGFEEAVNGAYIEFTIKTDVDLTNEQWAMVWLTGQMQGLGASRSQGFGTYTVLEWARLEGQALKDAIKRDSHPELLGIELDYKRGQRLAAEAKAAELAAAN